MMIHALLIVGAVVLCRVALAVGEALPTLTLPNCPENTLLPGEQKDFPVMLTKGNANVVSVGFTLEYDPAVLELCGAEAGEALDEQSFSHVGNPDAGTLQVVITPPFMPPPLPIIADGEIAKLCLKAREDAFNGCTVVSFFNVDMGDEGGHSIPIVQPSSGGILIPTPNMREPIPDIKANSSDDPITITENDLLSVIISLDPGKKAGVQADWWAAAATPLGVFLLTLDQGWVMSNKKPIPTYRGPLVRLLPVAILSYRGLPAGVYTFYFGVDLLSNGALDAEMLYYDSVRINIE